MHYLQSTFPCSKIKKVSRELQENTKKIFDIKYALLIVFDIICFSYIYLYMI